MIPPQMFSQGVEKVLSSIAELIKNVVEQNTLRWFAIKLFERDQKVMEQVNLSQDQKDQIEALIVQLEEELDDDSESIITNERYNYISGIVNKCVHKKNTSKMSTSDKIDTIVTNRFLALPIFAAVMFLVLCVRNNCGNLGYGLGKRIVWRNHSTCCGRLFNLCRYC